MICFHLLLKDLKLITWIFLVDINFKYPPIFVIHIFQAETGNIQVKIEILGYI